MTKGGVIAMATEILNEYDCGCCISVGEFGPAIKYCSLHAHAEDLLSALKRIIPMARDSKHEDFSDMAGNEDSRTAALTNALTAINHAKGSGI